MSRCIDADALKHTLCELERQAGFGTVRDSLDGFKLLISKAPTVCAWHDLKDECPKKDGEYLCLSIVNTIPPHWRTDVYRWNKSHFWWNDSEWGEGIADDVYYWMEIPPMPKMNAERKDDE